MRRAPGLRAAFGHLVGLGQVVQVLVAVIDRDDAGIFRADFLLEFGLEILADDEYDLAETGADGVKDAVVEDCLAGRSDGVDLFQAAIARAHACCEYY